MDEPPEIDGQDRVWFDRGYDSRREGLSSLPLACLACGAEVSRFNAPDGRPYWQVHDEWHGELDGR